MNLREFYNYKNRVIDDIVHDINIIHLIDKDLTVQTAGSLVYTQIFPYEYLPEVADKGKTFICIDVDIATDRDGKSLFYKPAMYIWVFTHKSLMRLDEGGVRVDNLCGEICKKINGSKYYGMGSLEFKSSRRFAPIAEYQGKVLTFSTIDWNRTYNPKTPVPSQRGYDA